MSESYEAPPTNTIATVSAVLGVLSVVGTGCCCVPLISYLAMVIVPLLSIGALVTGFMGRAEAARTGVGGTPAAIGIAGGSFTIVICVAIFGLGILAGVGVGVLSILGNQSGY